MVEDRTAAIDKEIKDGDNQWDGSWFHPSREELAEIGLSFWKPEVGMNFIIVIPPNEPGYFGKKLNVHYDVGPSKSAFLCLRQMKKEPCPLCEERGRVISEAPEGEKAEIPRTLKSVPPRYMFFILDMKDEETLAKGVQLYIGPQKVNDGLKKLCINKRTGEVIDVSNPENHFSVMFERTGEGRYNTDYVSFERELRIADDAGEAALKEDKDQIDELTAGLPRFDDLIVWGDYETIETEYFGPKGHGRIPAKAEEKPEGPKEEPAPSQRRRGLSIPKRGPALAAEKVTDEGGDSTETAVSLPGTLRERLDAAKAKKAKDLEG